ncbi:MAG: esterase family protein [Armatimonadetes bacterium]|nr:esterase family protein [Armatimonadota bacterium]
MELRVYGHAGKPAIVFPSQEGRFFEYEDFGMVEVCVPYLEAGKLLLITVDSVDGQSWLNGSAHPRDRALRHNDYDRYIVDEVIPFARGLAPGEGIMSTGCSMGGYHSANFYFRHPDKFDSLIALSGVYRLNLFIGDYMDEHVYYHVPLAYLPGLEDPHYLEHYCQGKIVVCVGQGAWEDDMVADTRALQKILEDKKIPARIDYWGYDVNHDWVWWRKMMPYFLDSLFS